MSRKKPAEVLDVWPPLVVFTADDISTPIALVVTVEVIAAGRVRLEFDAAKSELHIHPQGDQK